MNETQTAAQLLAKRFPYKPTPGQEQFFEQIGAFLTPEEYESYRTCVLLRGYAGTGKTTLVGTLINVLPRFGYKSVLLAPTGVAAGDFNAVNTFAGVSNVGSVSFRNSATFTVGKVNNTSGINAATSVTLEVNNAGGTINQAAGADGAIVSAKVLDSDSANYGYDARLDRYCDMVKEGIIDPTKVVRFALQNAASVATLLLTSDALVAEMPKEEKKAGGGGGDDMY